MVFHTLEDCLHQIFNNREYCIFITEAHFNINLCEFRLSVSTQIFIAETSCNLEILFHTSYHQQLLVDLWRLR